MKPADFDHRNDVHNFLASGGEMGERMRRFDWSRSPLGPVDQWPQSLRTSVSICLNSQFPINMAWGPDLVILYNDAFIPILGIKHPDQALGVPNRECFREIWEVIGPMLEGVLRTGTATWSEDLLLPLERSGYLEECYFTFSYSPIRDESGGVGGVFIPVKETTEKVITERRLSTLRELADRGVEPRNVQDACRIAAQTLEKNPYDLSFVAIYVCEGDSKRALLAGAAGIEAGTRLTAPLVDLDPTNPERPVFADAVLEKRSEVFTRPALGSLPEGVWSTAPEEVMVIPLTVGGQINPCGFLIAGVNPRKRLDADYRRFLELVAGQIGDAIVAGQNHEEEKRRTLRLLKLVNSLLDFSRIEAGRIQAAYEPTELAGLTRELASAFQSAIEQGGVRFEVDCPSLPEPVYVDRSMWEKIVLNLLSNAFKFTLEGSIAITLRAAGDHVELSVADTGIGIPKHELPRVFERFHRIEETRARTHEGTGIGLALVHDLVNLHGGNVSVASTFGSGTTFTVSIPLGKTHLPADRIAAPRTMTSTAVQAETFVQEALRWFSDLSEPETEGVQPADAGGSRAAVRTTASGNARILVADDNADMRDYVARLLRQQWSVQTVADGAQALWLTRQTQPDLIVTDVMMPRLDGFALIRALRDDPRTAHIPVLMLSARAGEESRVEGLAAGADDYLVKPFSARELIARVHVHLENVRLRRAAEAERNQLRALLSQVPATVNFLRGPDLVIEFAHPLAIAALGGRDVINKPLLEALPEFRDQEYPRLLRRVIETGERIEGRETLVRIADSAGELRDTYWNFTYLPVRSTDGKVEGVMTFDLEVTEQVLARRKVEEQAEQLSAAHREAEAARAVAEAANGTKDEFMAMLGHELRNPLSPILTATQLMRMRGRNDKELEIIERQLGHLVRLVDDLLDISRITRGKVELRKQPLELASVALKGVEMASPLLEQRQQTLDFRVSPEGLLVEGDPDRLAQVVSNLVTNASKYSEPGTSIHVTATRTAGRVILRVRDDGIGIAPAMLDRIFDTFVQHPQASDRAKGGLGLGLAIVRSLVELHGGTVSVTSEGPGTGSEFIVELPQAPGFREVAPAVAPRRDLPLPELPSPAREPRRILVVDDNQDTAETIAQVLLRLGHDVKVAHDGPSALSIAMTFKPSVCLLDIGLPVMDGYELARRLRAIPDLPPDLRLVAITGYGQDADRQRSKDAGFKSHVVKPVSLGALTTAVAAE